MLSPDEFYMNEALLEAQKAFDCGEVPVGAVLVLQGEIVARAHNLVEALQDATAHAEILCLRDASQKLGQWRLLNATLYTTLEPCCQCAGAMILSRIGALVWGASDLRQGAHGSWVNILDAEHPIHQFPIRKGVYAERASLLIKDFFQKKRRENHAGKFI